MKNEKLIAAKKGLEFIKNGMTVGLGTGSTVSFLIKELAVKVKAGLKITAVSTSNSTTQLASSLGIKIFDLSDISVIDITIDGADEVDDNLDGIKGGGGALLYEKIIAKNSKKNIWIVDSSKLVEKLGKFPIPVEVVKFGAEHLFNTFSDMNFYPQFRMKEGKRFITDGEHFIIDLKLNVIEDAVNLEERLKKITGVVETGLFCGIADVVIKGNSDGTVSLKKRDQTII
jgi:ribose 5-phosphate isomerase A